MKKIIAIIALTLASTSAIAASHVKSTFGCAKHQQVFFAYTAKHTKAVELCKVSNGYKYTFGPINKPEISVIQPASAVSFTGGMGGGFEFKNGNVSYISYNGKFGDSSLTVEKNGKEIADIEMDTSYGDSVNNTFDMLD